MIFDGFEKKVEIFNDYINATERSQSKHITFIIGQSRELKEKN